MLLQTAVHWLSSAEVGAKFRVHNMISMEKIGYLMGAHQHHHYAFPGYSLLVSLVDQLPTHTATQSWSI